MAQRMFGKMRKPKRSSMSEGGVSSTSGSTVEKSNNGQVKVHKGVDSRKRILRNKKKVQGGKGVLGQRSSKKSDHGGVRAKMRRATRNVRGGAGGRGRGRGVTGASHPNLAATPIGGAGGRGRGVTGAVTMFANPDRDASGSLMTGGGTARSPQEQAFLHRMALGAQGFGGPVRPVNVAGQPQGGGSVRLDASGRPIGIAPVAPTTPAYNREASLPPWWNR